ncbi:AMP-binding protein [Spirillospora sp. NPDC029432]|uniref:protein kinase family protein n=1 Tax=Spirillospora sp. NPDC029432 TaxID=3154599 RepID=UPI0034527BFF
MSTSVIEPGTRLAGRYRLEKRIKESGGSSFWKAIDEILARAVAVRTFDPDFPRIAEVVTSARAASRLTDPRLTQVFDADDSGESAYVVSEWVAGETLEQMLQKAPLEPGRAATLLYEAAEAIAAAHEAGLAHLCLSPRDLVWTTGGTVKVLGIATDAVLADRYSDEPARRDVESLGGMLYAALTAHWPGDPERSALPAAPEADGSVKAPRQVQAGVPYAVDAIVCRCLGIEVAGQEPLADPAELAKALRGVPRTPLPLFAGLGSAQPPAPARHNTQARTQHVPPPARPAERQAPGRGQRSAQHQHPQQGGRRQPAQQGRAQRGPQHGSQHGPPPAVGTRGTMPASPRPGGFRTGNRALLGVAAAALTVIVGLGAWAIGSSGSSGEGERPGATDQPRASRSAAPQAGRLDVANVFEAEKSSRGRHDTTIGKNLNVLTDGRNGEIWETQTYAGPDFGKLAEGLGVVLDMGRNVEVSSVKVATPAGGGNIQIKVGAQRDIGSMAAFASQSPNAGETTFKGSARPTGRYVLVWFTQLPSPPKGKMSEITVYGVAKG